MGETGVDIERFERRICGILRASHPADDYISNTTMSLSTCTVVPAVASATVSEIMPIDGPAIILIVGRCMPTELRDELEGF